MIMDIDSHVFHGHVIVCLIVFGGSEGSPMRDAIEVKPRWYVAYETSRLGRNPSAPPRTANLVATITA